ncbi:MAG: dihydroorotate dehydrogenase electron transfer subunit [Muribaculaceae bacterium]|nr:dihydroorotate dehydrogenase electron transfer subunit [Muribaculaceae bacterium]
MKSIRQTLTIKENRQVTDKTWYMRLAGDVSAITAPGQFVNLQIPGKYLRRPISVHQAIAGAKEISILYDVAGEGTEILTKLGEGRKLDVLVGLGNGFSIPEEIEHPLLLGGGIGCAPLLQLGIDLLMAGKKPVAIFGFNTKKDIIPIYKRMSEIGIPSYIATVDGSAGTKGFVTDAIAEKNIQYDYFYGCGPTPMLKALCELPTPGQLSLECRMGCGFGVCMCCSLETAGGVKRICKDGPVFDKEDLIWK